MVFFFYIACCIHGIDHCIIRLDHWKAFVDHCNVEIHRFTWLGMNYRVVFSTINLGTNVQVSRLGQADDVGLYDAVDPVARKDHLHITSGDQETISHCCPLDKTSRSYRTYKTT